MTDPAAAVFPEARAANPYLPEVAADPPPFYERLREHCPIALMEGFDEGVHLISRYDDVKFALRHPEIFSSDVNAVDIGQDRPLIPLQIDPPDHAHYRRVMDPHLSHKELAPLEGDTRALVNEIIDGFVEQGACDFHQQFSMPLPCMVFLSLTGLPIGELGQFLSWKDNIIRPDTFDPDEAAQIRKDTGATMYAYFADAIDQRSAYPTDDLISRFMRTEVDGRTMTRDEMLDLCYLFILGGLDTVTATLDCSIAYLAQHGDHRGALAADTTLVPGAIEELLRTQTPVVQVLRVMAQPYEMHGVEMQVGDSVVLMLGAANTDPAEFGAGADGFRLDRDANRHLAFGGGPHRCLGSHLARLELRIALEEWHRRVPDYGLADGAELTYSPAIREIASLPLVWS